MATNGATTTVLREIISVHRLTREAAARGQPVILRGVTTCVLPELHAIVIQDSTASLYVVDPTKGELPLPHVGELVEVEGVTEAGQAKAAKISRLGAGVLPEPERPSWDQLMNGSLDCRLVEIRGVVESFSYHRASGWSRMNLRTRDGVLRVELWRAGIQPGPLEKHLNAVIRLRGCMFAAWDIATARVKSGQIRMHDAEVILEEPAPEDLFSIPRTTAAALMRFDPSFSAFHRVKITGQVVCVRGYDYFVMDGEDGLRLLGDQSLGLEVGDLVEAVGFPEWGNASPSLRGVIARKTSHAALPAPKELSPEELLKSRHDATLVSVAGVLASKRQSQSSEVLEMQCGSWRFLARINPTNELVQSLRLGSRLELTGVYCAQGGNTALGEDVAPIDLLINSPADIKVLATPSWWTLQRLLVVAALLACLLIAMLLWVTQLHRKVEERTVELRAQIQNRERAEHQRAMKQERARIARDLHDELGADITEVGMLATRTKSSSASDAERNHCLEQLAGRTSQMISALEEIVWAMNPQHDSLVGVVSYFTFYADRFLGLANIKLQIEQSPAAADRAVDACIRHELFLAFKEALANVVNHAGATEVRLDIQLEQNKLRLAVADNGHGIHAGRNAGNGLANMRTRIEKIGGQFEITSHNGSGVTVKFSAPLS